MELVFINKIINQVTEFRPPWEVIPQINKKKRRTNSTPFTKFMALYGEANTTPLFFFFNCYYVTAVIGHLKQQQFCQNIEKKPFLHLNVSKGCNNQSLSLRTAGGPRPRWGLSSISHSGSESEHTSDLQVFSTSFRVVPAIWLLHLAKAT